MDDRRIGVEIEFAGLDARGAAACVGRVLGGEIETLSEHRYTLKGSSLGDLRFELDTALAKPAADEDTFGKALEELGTRGLAADILSTVVPVELVTPPILREEFAELDRAVEALRAAGCEGTEGGLLYAFGLHLNPELKPDDPERAVRIAAAYAAVERWLRFRMAPDRLRRVSPFVDAYPSGFVEEVAKAVLRDALPDIERFVRIYAAWNPTRNRGLDLWPLLGHLAPEAAAKAHEGPIKNARPTFHYRLPDSRLGEPGWSPLAELERWEAVEALADDPERLKAAATASRDHEQGRIGRADYLARISQVMA